VSRQSEQQFIPGRIALPSAPADSISSCTMYLSDIIGKEQKITNSLTLFVAPPTPRETAFIF